VTRPALNPAVLPIPPGFPLVDELTNTVEFFIHHEDVRRGQDGWEPRDLAEGHARAIWRAVRFTGKIALRRVRIPVQVREANGYGEFTVGGESPPLTVVAPAGELALFLSGRQRAARVSVEGPADQAQRLREARLAL